MRKLDEITYRKIHKEKLEKNEKLESEARQFQINNKEKLRIVRSHTR